MATGVDEVSFLNVSTFCAFELLIAPTAHEEHVEAFALLPDRARSTTATSLSSRRPLVEVQSEASGWRKGEEPVRQGPYESNLFLAWRRSRRLRTCASCDNCDVRSGGGAVGR